MRRDPDAAGTVGPEARVEDAETVERLRRGDREAFGALVRRFGGPLLRFARAIVHQEAVAEEVVQDVWLAVLDSIDRFEGRSSLKTWIFRILVNRARTRAEREGRTVPLSTLNPEGEGEPALEPDRFDARGAWRDPPARWTEENPERLALGEETRAVLERAVARLPAAQRAVLLLRDFEGLETREICDLLDVSVTNQRVLLHRARTRVRRALERHLRGEG